MKTPTIWFWRCFGARQARKILIFTLILAVSGCSFHPASPNSTLKIPYLPNAFMAFSDCIGWETSGSCVKAGPYTSGDTVYFEGNLHSEGDWVCMKPRFRQGTGWEDGLEPNLPVIGWVSGAGGDADSFGGLCAVLLERIVSGGASFAGLNLVRLLQEVHDHDIDSTNADADRIVQAIAGHQLSVRDLSPRPTVPVRFPMPPGVWLNGHGVVVAVVAPPVSALLPDPVSIELPFGSSDLFRQDGRAFLRLRVTEDGNGAPAVFWLLHQRKV